MRPSPLSDLQPLAGGAHFLARHPLQGLGLAVLTVVLAFLGPVLQIWTPVPDGPAVSMTLAVVSLVPLELYFMPRFLLRLDAEALDDPRNPEDAWRATFETRWMKAFAAKLALYLAVGAGITCFIVPGLILLAVFGWAPYRVLLRGEPLKEAARASALLMLRLWPRVLLPVSAILGVHLLALSAALWIETRFIPDPATPWIRLTHPAAWSIDFAGGLLNLWISATFLALYHRIERYGPAPEPPPEA